jgi:hypothetical protein
MGLCKFPVFVAGQADVEGPTIFMAIQSCDWMHVLGVVKCRLLLSFVCRCGRSSGGEQGQPRPPPHFALPPKWHNACAQN